MDSELSELDKLIMDSGYSELDEISDHSSLDSTELLLSPKSDVSDNYLEKLCPSFRIMREQEEHHATNYNSLDTPHSSKRMKFADTTPNQCQIIETISLPTGIYASLEDRIFHTFNNELAGAPIPEIHFSWIKSAEESINHSPIKQNVRVVSAIQTARTASSKFLRK